MIPDRIRIKSKVSLEAALIDYGLKPNMLLMVNDRLSIKIVDGLNSSGEELTSIEHIQDVINSKGSFWNKDNVKILYFDISTTQCYKLVKVAGVSGSYYDYIKIDPTTNSNMVAVTEDDNLTVALNKIKSAVDKVEDFEPSKFSVYGTGTWDVGFGDGWLADSTMILPKNVDLLDQPNYKEITGSGITYYGYQAIRTGTYKLCLDVALDAPGISAVSVQVAIAKAEIYLGSNVVELLAQSSGTIKPGLQNPNLNLSTVVELAKDEVVIACIKGDTTPVSLYDGEFNFHGYHIFEPTEDQITTTVVLIESGYGMISEDGIGTEVSEEGG